MYERDVLSGDWRRRRAVPEVDAEVALVVEDVESGFCGAVISVDASGVVLEDRHGRHRLFPLLPAAFLLDGALVTLRRPAGRPGAPAPPGAGSGGGSSGQGGPPVRQRTASGSIAVPAAPARVARASRIWVEGLHDATLIEKIWGDDLRVEGVVVEPLDGVDALPDAVRAFGPAPHRRLGVLVDHLIDGSKESRIVAAIRSPYVLVTGHPYVDVWAAVRPERLGIRAWPAVPMGQPWKEGVCAALGVADPAELWRRILGAVRDYRDVQPPLIGAVERLIDFVTEPSA